MRSCVRRTLVTLAILSPVSHLSAQDSADSLRAALPWTDHTTNPGGPRLSSLVLGVNPDQINSGPSDAASDTTIRRRAKALQLSDAYAVRLKIHQVGSFLEFPVFAAEIIVGQKLARDRDAGTRSSSSLRGAHSALAAGLGVLFGVNTITGGWNLVEGWNDPKGRTRRVIHSVAMLAADAGFLLTAGTAPDDDRFESGGRGNSVGTHRAWAISSSAIATAATLMMWLWKS